MIESFAQFLLVMCLLFSPDFFNKNSIFEFMLFGIFSLLFITTQIFIEMVIDKLYKFSKKRFVYYGTD